MISSWLLAGALAASPAEPTPAEWSSRVGEQVVVYDRPGNRFEGELVAYDQQDDRLVLESDGHTMLLPAGSMSLVPTAGPERTVVTEGESMDARVQGPPRHEPPPPEIGRLDEGYPLPLAEWRKGTRRMGIGGGLLVGGTVISLVSFGGLISASLSELCILCEEEEREASNERARRKRVVPTVGLVTGAVTSIVGIAFLIDGGARRIRARKMDLEPYLSLEGGGLSLTGRF